MWSLECSGQFEDWSVPGEDRLGLVGVATDQAGHPALLPALTDRGLRYLTSGPPLAQADTLVGLAVVGAGQLGPAGPVPATRMLLSESVIRSEV